MRAVIRGLVVLVAVAGGLAGLHIWLQGYQKPTIRMEIANPLYTVANGEYGKALQEGRQVVQFGPLPWSIYHAGALAFQLPEEALLWLKTTGKWDQGWRVFELSGDYRLDTHLIRGLPHTNKTLLINKEVPMQ